MFDAVFKVALSELISDENFERDRACFLCNGAIKPLILVLLESFVLELVLQLRTLDLCYHSWSLIILLVEPFHQSQGALNLTSSLIADLEILITQLLAFDLLSVLFQLFCN